MTRTYPKIPNPVARVGVTITWGMFPVLAIFLAIVVPIFVLVSVAHFALGDGGTSIWQIPGAGAFKYFPLALAIMLTPAFLPIYVAQGVTRHYIARGGAIFIAFVSVGFGIVMAVGYAVEKLALDAAGVEYVYDQPHLFSHWWDVHLIVAEYALLIGAHMMAGWLIGSTYYILGWFRATLLLPASAVPAIAAEVILNSSWAGEALNQVTGYTRPPLAVAITAALAVIALAWVVNTALIRNVPIKLRSS